MIELIIYLLLVVGITTTISKEFILGWFRDCWFRFFEGTFLESLISCPTCMGFWVGVACHNFFPIQQEQIILTMLISGFCSLAINYIVGMLSIKF